MTFHQMPRQLAPSRFSLARAARVVAEDRYRNRPSAATFAAYRLAVYREVPTPTNYTLYQRAVADLRTQVVAASRAAMIAARRSMAVSSQGRLSGLGAVLAVM